MTQPATPSTSPAATAPAAASPAHTHPAATHTGRRPGTMAVLRWEATKLAAQARARYLLLACLIVPPIVVAVFKGQQPPSDTVYGRHIHTSGYAVPLLMLAWAAQWAFPLLASLVGGDMLVLAASTIASSLLLVGTQPLPGLTGQLIASGTALKLVATAWATALPPLLGFTALAILLSVTTRNPTVGVAAPVVLGFAMQMLSTLGGLDLARRLLLTTPFEAWHGLFTQHRFYGPLDTAVAVSAGWTVICLTIAYLALRRRDIIGG
jgi:ABC-2 type transport system permease protein